MDDQQKRQAIGDSLISGKGYEVGAGISPSRYTGVQQIIYLDVRDRAALEDLFKSTITYDVQPIDDVHEPADFLIAHHVIEHAADPIGTIIRWSGLVREGGRIFFSLPAEDHPCEKDRLATPFEHMLHDYLFERGTDHFDSKQHIPHFIDQWTVMDTKNFWYAQTGVERFAAMSLSEVRRDGNDIHWHTYSLSVFEQVVTAAFWIAGHDISFQHREHWGGTIYLVVEKEQRSSKLPIFLRPHHDRLVRAASTLAR